MKTVSNGWFRDANLAVTAAAIYSNIFQFLRGHIFYFANMSRLVCVSVCAGVGKAASPERTVIELK